MSEQLTNQPSQARLTANRENAQKSTGPSSAAGKAAIRFNAVKNGLTGQTILIYEEDAARYESHIAGYQRQFQPIGPEECALVQSIADIRWRLNRIPGLELALLAKGQQQVIEQCSAYASAEYQVQLEFSARARYEKEFRNLHLQENRLARRREREMAELLRLQAARKAGEAEALAEAAKEQLLARHRKQSFAAPSRVGFDFSKLRFDQYFSRLTDKNKQELLAVALAEAPETISESVEAAA